MKNISKSELAAILTQSRECRVKFALEIENVNESESESSIFTFKEAFSHDLCKNPTEFMAVFADANSGSEEYDAELNISVNALCPEFSDKCTEKIREIIDSGKISEIKVTIHTDNAPERIAINNPFRLNLPTGELIHSFYYDADIYAEVPEELTMRMLGANDKNLCGIFEEDEEEDADDYFATVFGYTIDCPKYKDCGIIGAFDADGKIVGYLSYYGLDVAMRDVSYIYVGKNYRRRGYGRALLNFFKNKNIDERKISYYSYPENRYSERLAEECGFLPCAYRYEYINSL